LRQIWFAPHCLPQLPQLLESLRTSVQVAPHACWPSPQVVGPSGWPSGNPPSQSPPGQITVDAS
jgi:hypothetical protein